MTDPITRLNTALEGRYRVEREIGEGGMATVYLAHDERHNRNVALKVLKAELAAVVGGERFLAEIETTAQLTHPHILPLFDSGEADGFLFFVMPYIEGDTLRDKIDREKQLGIEDALKITEKVASALDYAHEHGVVHRDIKPGNILLSERGEPTVADFGIALAVAQAGGGRVTETGLSIGTPHYMSPEQATGDRDVDPRTDVYALGCVLFEMLAGEPPYTGANAQAVLAKILTDPAPDPTKVRVSIPPNVDAAIRKALEKLPADRFTTAQEFARALADPTFRHGEEIAEGVAEGRGQWTPLAIAATGIAVVLAVGFGWAILRPEPAGQVSRVEVSLQDGLEVDPLLGVNVTVSPDGSRIVFVGTSEGVRQLWQRPLSQLSAVLIPGTEGAREPRFSPDGESIVYHPADGRLMTVLLGGAPPQALVLDSVEGGQAWGSDGYIYFNKTGMGVWRVPEDGGAEEEITTLGAEESVHDYVDVLPNGRGILFTRRIGSEREVVSFSLETGVSEVLFVGQTARYAPTGHVVFVTPEGNLGVAPFDANRIEVTGPVRALQEQIWVNPGGSSQFTLSQNGDLVYLPSGSAAGAGGGAQRLVVVDLEGNEEDLTLAPRPIPNLGVGWSPNGESVVYESEDQIFTYNVALGTTPRQLTFEGDNSLAVFSPDGNSVAFTSNREGTDGRDLFVKDLNDDSPPRSIVSLDGNQDVMQWPSDTIIVFERRQLGNSDLWVVNLSDPDNPIAEAYLSSEADLQRISVSPDGTLAAYRSNESGQDEIYIRSFPEPGERTLVSQGGGVVPFWSPDGNTLYYLTGPQQPVMAARLQLDPVPVVQSTDVLFQSIASVEMFPGSALHPDGDRFILAQNANIPTAVEGGASEPERLILVQNFFEELRQVVPD